MGESDYADWCLTLQQQIHNLQQEFKEKEVTYIQKIKALTDTVRTRFICLLLIYTSATAAHQY